MMGYLALLVVLFMWLRGARGSTLTLTMAGLLFGGAGYALTGSPGLAGRPVAERPPLPDPMSLKGAREAFYGRFTWLDRWAIISESYAARGKTWEAAGILRSGLREHPRSAALWSLYGNALTDHAGGYTPAAELAYDRAIALAPGNPGPRFFKALAQLRSGLGDEALPELERLAAETPERADWRPLVKGALSLARESAASSAQSAGS